MKMKQKWLLFFAAILVFLYPNACNNQQATHDPSLIETWKIGSSSGVLEDFSKEEFTRIKAAGIDCIELGLRDERFYVPSAERESLCLDIAAAAASAGVQIWSVHIPYGENWDISTLEWNERQKILNKHRQLFGIFSILKPKKAVIHPSFEPIPEGERAIRLNACKDALSILAAEAEDYGVQLVIECLPRTCLGNSSDEILYLLKSSNSLGVCCDVNHLLSETPEEFILNVGASITTLHISDYDGLDEKHWLPGEGIINWNLVIDSLVASGYSGPFLFECKGTAEDLSACWDRLKSDYLQFSGKTN